ncbi:MAG: NifU family protein [Patescibacteria group bacterium]
MAKITIKDKIKKILEKEIAPMLAMHGGRVKFVDFRAGVVEIVLQGSCHGCVLSQLTLKEGIERTLKAKIPAVKKVNDIGQ